MSTSSKSVPALGCLHAAAITMYGELVPRDAVATTRGFDEALRERHRLARCEHSPDDVTTVQIEHDIQLIVVAFMRPFALRDVPRPHRIRLRRHEARHRVRRMRALCAALAHLVICGENPIHRARTAEIRVLFEQRRIHLRRRAVDKPCTLQLRQHRRLLTHGQRARRRASDTMAA